MKLQQMNERIHRGFRAWLLELNIMAGQTDFLQIEQGRKMVARMHALIRAWELKFEMEAQQIFPALALKAPYSVFVLDEEKRMAENKCRLVARIIEQYKQPGLPIHYASTGKALVEAFSNMAEFLVRYMKLEDRLLSAAKTETLFTENGQELIYEIIGLAGEGMNRNIGLAEAAESGNYRPSTPHVNHEDLNIRRIYAGNTGGLSQGPGPDFSKLLPGFGTDRPHFSIIK